MHGAECQISSPRNSVCVLVSSFLQTLLLIAADLVSTLLLMAANFDLTTIMTFYTTTWNTAWTAIGAGFTVLAFV